MTASADYLRELEDALRTIARWEFPPSGRFYDEPLNTRPMSYESAFGSGGARDYMKTVASDALARQREQVMAAPQELPAVNSARPANELGRELPPKGGKPDPHSSLIRDSAKYPAGAATSESVCEARRKGAGEADAKDAARYRWLRECVQWLDTTDLDAAIDAALRTQPAPAGGKKGEEP